MSTEHHHNHSHCSAAKNIQTAFLLNLAFCVIEIAGGAFTGSMSILAGAVHDLGDSISLGFAFYLERIAGKHRDMDFHYGYRRFSLLGALVSGMIMVMGAFFILSEAVPRLWHHGASPQGRGMLLLAAFGVLVNAVAAVRLSRGKTQNEKMLTWHQIEDSLSWLAVLVVALLMLQKNWAWLDPALAIALSAFVLWNVVKRLHETVRIFLQAAPPGFSRPLFVNSIKAIPHVFEVHDLHVWSLDGAHNVISLHLVLDEVLGRQEVSALKKRVSEVAAGMGEFHLTIETEIKGDPCFENCDVPHKH